MSSINTVAVSGNLVRDPELRQTGAGTDVTNCRIAVSRSRKTESGYEEETSFFSVTIWGNFGALVARKFRKGDKMIVQGRLQQREWEAQDGSKREGVEIVAESVDGEAMYRKDGEVPAASESQSPASGQQTLAAAADDDIPF